MLCAADGALRVDLRGIVAGIGDADRHRGADQNGGIDLKHKIIIVINVQALQNIADAVAAALSVYDGLILLARISVSLPLSIPMPLSCMRICT